MSSFNLEESEQFFFIWQDKAMQLSERMKKIIDDMPPRVQEMLINQITHFIYASYDIEKPIQSQLERNYLYAEQMLSSIERKIAELLL